MIESTLIIKPDEFTFGVMLIAFGHTVILKSGELSFASEKFNSQLRWYHGL